MLIVFRTQALIFRLEVDISAYKLTQINVILSYEARIRTFVNWKTWESRWRRHRFMTWRRTRSCLITKTMLWVVKMLWKCQEFYVRRLLTLNTLLKMQGPSQIRSVQRIKHWTSLLPRLSVEIMTAVLKKPAYHKSTPPQKYIQHVSLIVTPIGNMAKKSGRRRIFVDMASSVHNY